MEKLNFRTKLLLCFIGLALFNAAVFSSIAISNTRKTVVDDIRSNALSIAASAAVLVDGDLHEQIQKPGDEASEAYVKLEAQLRAIRDANRREDVNVVYMYTIRRVSSDPDKWVYVVDAEEAVGGLGEKSTVGEVVQWEGQGTPGKEPHKLGEAYANRHFVTDDYGYWLTANAPIRNSKGEIVAMLGVDFDANNVIKETRQAMKGSLIGLILSIILTGFVAVLLSQWISKPLKEIVTGLTKIGKGHLNLQMDESRDDEFGEINRTVNEMAQTLLERDALQGALSRYVSQDAVQNLIKSGEFPTFRGNRKKMTILLCTISNLEDLSESISPGKLVEMLNSFFDRMVGVIFKHHGTIDQLPGDGLSAVFGALGDEQNQENSAVQAALDLIAENEENNKRLRPDGVSGFELQVGIHSGEAIFGNIGSDHRVEFTVVGKTMKIASALGSLNEQFKTRVLVSEATQGAIPGDYPFVEVGEIKVGVENSVLRLFTLKNLLTEEVSKKIDGLADADQ